MSRAAEGRTAAFHLRQLLAHNAGDADKLRERLKCYEQKLKQRGNK
jgi:hypothetical protein